MAYLSNMELLPFDHGAPDSTSNSGRPTAPPADQMRACKCACILNFTVDFGIDLSESP